MAKSLFEEMGGRYKRQGDYLIPCITLSDEEEQSIGLWGERHLHYLKEIQKRQTMASMFLLSTV